MLNVLGFIFATIIMLYASVCVFFVTVPTFGDALFSGKWYHRLFGAVLWCVCIYGWYKLFSMVTITI